MQIQFYLTHCSTDRIGTAHISIWSHAQKHINNPVANKCSCKYTSKYTNIQIFKYTNIQIHKYTNTQIYKYTNMQIHKYTNIQIYNYKNIHHLPIRKHLHLHLYNNEFKCNHFITKSEKKWNNLWVESSRLIPKPANGAPALLSHLGLTLAWPLL